SPSFFYETAPTAIYTLSLHDALPITLAEHRACRADAGHGQAQVGVGQQRVADQLLQHRVVELRPPLGHGDAGGEGFAGRVVQVHVRRYRNAVVGPDRARREHGGGDGHYKGADHHGSVSPRWVKVPVGPSAPSSAIATLLRAPSLTSISAPGFMSVL